MEDDLKIHKVEYFNNYWLDLSQILSLSWGDQNNIKNAWNEDDLKIQKLEYLLNHWLGLQQIFNLSSGGQTQIETA